MAVCIPTPHIEAIWYFCKRQDTESIYLALNNSASQSFFFAWKELPLTLESSVVVPVIAESDYWIELKRIIEGGWLCKPYLVGFEDSLEYFISATTIFEEASQF